METLQTDPSHVETHRVKTSRRVLRRDASNFDDYLVVGLVASVFIALLALLVIL